MWRRLSLAIRGKFRQEPRTLPMYLAIVDRMVFRFALELGAVSHGAALVFTPGVSLGQVSLSTRTPLSSRIF